MGFFSFDCRGCGNPLLSRHVTNATNGWMRDCLAIEADGRILHGDYDGYGRFNDVGVNLEHIDFHLPPNGNPCCWHRACWLAAGSPIAYQPSAHSPDQGFFYDDGRYDQGPPPWAQADLVRVFLDFDRMDIHFTTQVVVGGDAPTVDGRFFVPEACRRYNEWLDVGDYPFTRRDIELGEDGLPLPGSYRLVVIYGGDLLCFQDHLDLDYYRDMCGMDTGRSVAHAPDVAEVT